MNTIIFKRDEQPRYNFITARVQAVVSISCYILHDYLISLLPDVVHLYNRTPFCTSLITNVIHN